MLAVSEPSILQLSVRFSSILAVEAPSVLGVWCIALLECVAGCGVLAGGGAAFGKAFVWTLDHVVYLLPSVCVCMCVCACVCVCVCVCMCVFK